MFWSHQWSWQHKEAHHCSEDTKHDYYEANGQRATIELMRPWQPFVLVREVIQGYSVIRS